LKTKNLQPGDSSSINQYISTVHGNLVYKRKELKMDKYVGGTIFMDHTSGFLFAHNQVTMRAGDTLCSIFQFDNFASSCRVRVKSFRADNFRSASQALTEHLSACGQEIGAHHQNGVSERTIRTITEWSRSMILEH